MHDYNHFILGNRLLRWYNTITMRLWCIHFGRERNAKENENVIVNIQQAAANNIISSSTWQFFKRTSRQKKTKNGGKKLEKVLPLYRTRITFKDALDNCEQTGGGAGGKRPRQRGTDASFTCVLIRFCRDVRCPRHLPNVKTAAIFQPHPDETMKKQLSYFEVFRRSPDRGGILTSSKKAEKKKMQ